jgi:hypothetical protein
VNQEPRQTIPGPGGPIASVFQGVLLLGRGRAEGLNCFGATMDALMSALAPYVALIGVGAFALIARHGTAIEAVRLLLLLCVLLVRPVVSQILAQRWNRQGLWLRFATASLWASWLVQALIIIAFFLLHAMAPDLAESRVVGTGIMLGLQAYDLWLAWFIARVGLIVGPGRAAIVVLATVLAMVALYAIAAVLPPYYNAMGDLFSPPG